MRRNCRKIKGSREESHGQRKHLGKEYRKLNNQEIEEIFGEEGVTRHIKARRLRRFGHVKRTSPEKMSMRVGYWRLVRNIPTGD